MAFNVGVPSSGSTAPLYPVLLAGAHERNPKRGDFVSLNYNGKIDRCGVEHLVLDEREIKAMSEGAPPPDGIMVIQMHLSYWREATDHFLQNRGDIPTIVFSRRSSAIKNET